MEPSSRHLLGLLASGLTRLDLNLSGEQQTLLIDYLLLLHKWNNIYNLSGITDAEAMIGYHLLDSLAIAPYIDRKVILDIGTGAGLPGIPLAIRFPQKQFLLLDGNGKKTRFLIQVKAALRLANVEVFHDRVEHFQSRRQIDIVLCRAFASLRGIITQAGHLLDEDTRLLAMKGQYPEAELADLPAPFHLVATHALSVPGVQGARHLVEISRERKI